MKKFIALVTICILVTSSMGFGDDLMWPEWRGKWSTTVQYWDFLTPETDQVTPDGPGPLVEDPAGGGYLEPGYLPSTMLTIRPGEGMEYIARDDASNREGIWPLSGWIDVVVDNHPTPNPWKIMWVQITWRPQDIAGIPEIINPFPAPCPDYLPEVIFNEPLLDGWWHTVITWRIPENPPDESFTIGGMIDIDQLVIDTWCIPGPATVVLLALGGLLIRKRK